VTDRRSERQSAERTLPESDSKLREALETARQERDKAHRYLDIVADLVVSLDGDGRITLINRAGCRILGYDESELIGNHWFTTCLPTRFHRESRTRFQQVIAGEKPIIAYQHNHILTRTGEERLIAWHNTLLTDGDDKIVGTLSSGEDITERRRTEEVVSAIAQGTSATVGKAFFQPLVRCLAETLGMDYAFVGEVADTNARRVLTCARYSKGGFLENVEYDLADTPCANVVGKRLCCYPSGVQARFPRDRILGDIGAEGYIGTPLFDSTGRALGLLVVMDQAPIANPNFAESVLQIFAARAAAELERTRAEAALGESTERLKFAHRAARMGTWEWDIVGNRIIRSEDATLQLGITPDRRGDTFEGFLDLVRPEDREHLERTIHTCLENKDCDDYSAEYRVVSPEGSIRWIAEHGQVYRDETRKPIRLAGISMDITARKQAEEQGRKHQTELAHVARVSTMGEMASGLAHELNQPLTAVVNSAQSALNRLRSDTGVRQDVLEAIELASAQALRAAEIIRRLADFVQKHEPRRSSCNFNDAVREVVNLMAHEVRDQGVRIRLELAVDLPLVRADNIQIQQVILNLVRNGIEAMSEMPAGQRLLQIQTSVVGDAVEVAVRDRGSGLTPETRERLFTPFYTTKPHGMGMGLSISRSIIDAHGGRLWTTSNPDLGTAFHFTLPISADESDDLERPARSCRG
jgi:PAS domain S-box-containing protein